MTTLAHLSAGAPRVVLGIGGGIAAYKAVLLLRLLVEGGAVVDVVATQSALRFVGAPTWAALSGRVVHSSLWDGVEGVPHVRLGQQAQVVVVAPATANLLAKAAHGLADDLLTNVLLTARCPVLMAPAMHTEMWQHPATVANVALLRSRGVAVLDPAVGRLTGADCGPGRLPESEIIAAAVWELLARHEVVAADLVGRRVVVSAGGTREPVDPVRYLGNRSSGRQGYALASAALARGAQVLLVSANVTLEPPAGAELVTVATAAELAAAVLHGAADADAVVMAAAVADFRPVNPGLHKLKKVGSGAPVLVLEQTEDVLASLVAARAASSHPESPVLVGFAAETGDEHGDVHAHGRSKLARKGCDLLVVNDVRGDLAFDNTTNAAVVLGADGSSVELERRDKTALAHAVWDLVLLRLPAQLSA